MRSDRLTAFLVFLVLLGFYLAFTGDRYDGLPVSDEQVMFRTTVTLVEAGSLRPYLTGALAGHEAKYGLAQSLAAVPLYVVARTIAPMSSEELEATDPEAARRAWRRWTSVAFPLACATNALICAAIGAMFFGVARRLGYDRRVAIAGALIVGLATIVAPYSKSFFSAPLVALGLLGAVGAIARIEAGFGFRVSGLGSEDSDAEVERENPWSKVSGSRFRISSLLCGLGLSVAILARVDNVLIIPVFLAALWMGVKPDARREAFRSTLWFLAPLVVTALFIFWTNRLRSAGAPGGYSGEGFSTNLATGLWGLLFSPSRGVFWFSPPVALAVFYAVRFHRRHPRVGFVVFAIIAIKLFVFAKWWNWFGGWSWGARFLLPVVPLAMLALLEPLSRWRREKTGVEGVVCNTPEEENAATEGLDGDHGVEGDEDDAQAGSLCYPRIDGRKKNTQAGSLCHPEGGVFPLRQTEKALIVAVVAIGLAVQISGLLVAPSGHHGNIQFLQSNAWFRATGEAQPLIDREQLLMSSAPQSPLVGNWPILANGRLDWWGARFAEFFPDWAAAALFAILGLATLLSALALVRAWHQPPETRTPKPETLLSTHAPLPRTVRRTVWLLFGLNVAAFLALGLGIRWNSGLWRIDRTQRADGRKTETSNRVGAVYVDDDLEASAGLRAQTIEWMGYLETPTSGTYSFFTVGVGALDLSVGGRHVLTNRAAGGQLSLRVDVPLPRGVHPLHMRYETPLPRAAPTSMPVAARRARRQIHLYWSIPGGGEYEQIIGRPWLYPTRPGPARRLFAQFYRLKMGMVLVSILALWWIWLHTLFLGIPAQKIEAKEVADAPVP